MHDVRLTLFTRPDCEPCDGFAATVLAVLRTVNAQPGRAVSMETVSVADDPDRTANACVTVYPTLVAKVDGIPVARLDGTADTLTVAELVDSLELSDVI